jgi:hypothetical protein
MLAYMTHKEVQRVKIDDGLYEPLKTLASTNKLAIGDLIFTICESIINKKKFTSFYYPPNKIPKRQIRFNDAQIEKLEAYSKDYGVPISILLHTIIMKNSE